MPRAKRISFSSQAAQVYQPIATCVAACCSVMQRVAACCSVLQCVAVLLTGGTGIPAHCHLCFSMLQCNAACCSMLQHVAACCSVLQWVAVGCSGLQCVAAGCSGLQCNAVCCSVLQCVAVCCSSPHRRQRYVYEMRVLYIVYQLQHTATHCNTLRVLYIIYQTVARHSHSLRGTVGTATHCAAQQALQHTARHSRTATHCAAQ